MKKIRFLNKKLPSHEQIFFGVFLSFVGGFFDSFTFINSNGIFANAQTGNLIFIGLDLAQGKFSAATLYIPPVIAFVVGVIFSEYIIVKKKNIAIAKKINISLVIQIILLFLAYFLPYIANYDVRPLFVSFVCAMQFDSFRTVHNIPFASIFCTGNLRSASEHLFRVLYLKESNSKFKFFIYASLIFIFLLGVIIGGVISNNFKHEALLFVIFILILNLCISIFHDVKLRNKEH